MMLYYLFGVLTTLCSTRMTLSTTPSSIIFPLEETSQNLDFPLDLALMLSNVTDIDEFMNFMDESSRPKPILAARFGGPIKGKSFRLAKMSSCTPKLTTVCLKPSNADVATYYHPQCTDVARCSGCCAHDLLSCQPVEINILELGVVIYEFKGGKPLFYRGKEVVSIEEHKSCKCDCRVKASDCQKSQTYNAKQCRCICNNNNEQIKCHQEAPLKSWNPNTCTCVCRKILECSSGFYFDAENSCQCISKRSKRYLTSNWDGLNYDIN